MSSDTNKRYIDLRGVENLAEVVIALYNASVPLGMGWLHAQAGDMSLREAETELIRHEEITGIPSAYFDYLRGRVMKVLIGRIRPMRVDLYDRDNGEGAAERALADIKGWRWHNKDAFDE